MHKYRLIKGETETIVNIRAEMQIRIWNEQWARNMASVAKRQEKEERAWAKESKKQLAIDQTAELQKAIQDLDTLLISSLEPNHTIDWSTLKDTSEFPAAQPVPPVLPSPPPEPKFGEPRFTPQLNWFTRLIPPVRQKAQAHALDLFNKAHQDWARAVTESDKLGRTRAEEFKKARELWEQNKARWQEDQAKSNATIDQAEENYRSGKPESVAEYCEMVLHNSEYPESFPSDAVVAYVPETRTAVVEYSLPDISALPKLKEVKYVAAREAFQDVPVSETWLNRTYDSVLYQIALRSLHEIFQADAVNAIDSIVLNGWVTSTDKAIGKQVTGCVLSVHATKSEFMNINLNQVEPKACFKKLKGVSAAKLTALQPVRPILQINKEDKRFISPYGVADTLDNSSNLAAMDWEDFEQLIREVFEKEFSANGGEVKITRASRDGGVDAVVFDPDPIRGGKIVIQAKRYTHTVSVSAVRDLYGTIHNEGANKGILVSTADYGPDAYEFAKGKPITLLSGNELLYLLEKHGHNARIDLQEARLLNAEKEKTQRAGS
ncbi:MAG TPA: restriction endonuclease [Candidatus Angelobacter sp.]|nr:restriction endonuclease [Candidatus Angelobacter sp.]